MDMNKIFELFNGEEYNSLREKAKEKEEALNLKDHPLFWIGMFKKLIYNHKIFNKKIMGLFSILEEELDIYDVEQAGEFVVYNKDFFWIEKIDVNDKIHQDSISTYSDDILLSYLKISISYFEKLEEYEKCAHLKNIQNIVEKFLN